MGHRNNMDLYERYYDTYYHTPMTMAAGRGYVGRDL